MFSLLFASKGTIELIDLKYASICTNNNSNHCFYKKYLITQVDTMLIL